MNFLAHLHLADNSRTSLAANLAGDFAKGNIERFPKHLQQGIWLHRQIDQLTDTHELTQDLIKLFPKSHTRIAPILMDLAFDHILAKYWDEYHHEPLGIFCKRAYQEIIDCPELPSKLVTLAPIMRDQQWLEQYEHPQGLNKAIQGVAKRFSKPELFKGAERIVDTMHTDIEIAFRTFYPQLMAYSRIWTRKTPEQYL